MLTDGMCSKNRSPFFYFDLSANKSRDVSRFGSNLSDRELKLVALLLRLWCRITLANVFQEC
jgi:hypothetical protein